MLPFTTLVAARQYLGITSTEHDAELSRLVEQSAGVVDEMAGPSLRVDTFTETHRNVGFSGRLLLRHYPVVSVLSISSVYYGVVTAYAGPAGDYAVSDASIGEIHCPYRRGDVQVTYTAGLAATPVEAEEASLVYVAYRYRRNHGGSDTFMPAGADTVVNTPMGVRALRDQVRLALGPYARPPRVT